MVGYYAPVAGTAIEEGLGDRDGGKRKARALTSILGCDLGLHNFHGLPRPIIMVADEGPHPTGRKGAAKDSIEAGAPQ
jgi:hypothetical protein